ncbi:hypothetical protein Tco_0858300 [Tanacetum coccineum]|uniref:Reverse transcriptase domain-containing protein n=1 Tax=Tanacetum coccineum TaxID=301880 RepID=A0ABQ5B9R4_9ASTR
MLPVTQIDTFYNRLTLRHRDTINAAGGTFMKRRPEECYDLIENMTAHHNDWDTSAQRNESSSSITSSNPEIASLKLQMEEMNRNLTRVLQTNQQVNTVTQSCDTCGGPHSYNDCQATVGQNQNVYVVGAYNQGGNSYQPQERNLQEIVPLFRLEVSHSLLICHVDMKLIRQRHNKVNEIRAERLARTANPLALVAQQQPVYHHQNHPILSKHSIFPTPDPQQSTRNRGKKQLLPLLLPTDDPKTCFGYLKRR